jgi:hypothetical protein
MRTSTGSWIASSSAISKTDTLDNDAEKTKSIEESRRGTMVDDQVVTAVTKRMERSRGGTTVEDWVEK